MAIPLNDAWVSYVDIESWDASKDVSFYKEYVAKHLATPNQNNEMEIMFKKSDPVLQDVGVRDLLNELVRRGAIKKVDYNMTVPDGGTNVHGDRTFIESALRKTLGEGVVELKDAVSMTHMIPKGKWESGMETRSTAEVYVCIHPQNIGKYFAED